MRSATVHAVLDSMNGTNRINGTGSSAGVAGPAPAPLIGSDCNTVFRPNRLNFGLVVPLETYAVGPVTNLRRHVERAQLAESLASRAPRRRLTRPDLT